MIGKQLLNYKIVSLIGEGGMGNVYLGEHVSIGRKVAIKVLRPELARKEEIRSRFKNEAAVMAHLQHPGIVGLIDYLEQDDGLYLIMEYVEGIEFTDLLKSLDEPLPIDRAKDIMKKVLSAFAYAHKNNIVHRDVKPSNILLTKSDEVKVLDFGIAKLIGSTEFNLTKTGTQVGTVYYMSPEQVKAKELDHRSDVYSLGVTFYELLAGFCPYKSLTSEFEVYEKIVREPLLPLTEVMGEEYAQVWSVIQKATEKGIDDRFQNCDEFIAALNSKVKPRVAVISEPLKAAAVVEEPVAASGTAEPVVKPEVIPAEKTESNKKKRGLILTAIVLLLLLLFFLVKCLNGVEASSEDEPGNNRVTPTENEEPPFSEADTLMLEGGVDPRDRRVEKNSPNRGHSSENVDSIPYNVETRSQSNEILDFPDLEAEFPGGSSAMQTWISNNVHYPETSIEKDEQGKVYLSFVVEPNGEITNIIVERGVSQDLDREAKRVVRSMPRWNPGVASGSKVRTRCRLPITFTLE
jgi:TonB family protein